MKQDKKQTRDATAKEAERVSNTGHYLDRLENLAIALEDRSSEMAVMALKQLHAYSGCRPQGSDGIQYEISCRLLIKAERDFKFTKDQINRLWYGVHWDAREIFKLKFPYENEATDSMRSNTTKAVSRE